LEKALLCQSQNSLRSQRKIAPAAAGKEESQIETATVSLAAAKESFGWLNRLLAVRGVEVTVAFG
jgi:hypothetical protein